MIRLIAAVAAGIVTVVVGAYLPKSLLSPGVRHAAVTSNDGN